MRVTSHLCAPSSLGLSIAHGTRGTGLTSPDQCQGTDAPGLLLRSPISSFCAPFLASTTPHIPPPRTPPRILPTHINMPYSKIDSAAEKADYEKQTAELKKWWATPRYEGIVRPYSAAEIASKRGSALGRSVPIANGLSEKLFKTLTEHDQVRISEPGGTDMTHDVPVSPWYGLLVSIWNPTWSS